MHFYSGWLLFFAVALLHVFVDTEEVITMLADATVAGPSEAFLQLMNLLCCGQLTCNKEHEVLIGLQVTSFPWKGEAGVQRLLVHVRSR